MPNYENPGLGIENDPMKKMRAELDQKMLQMPEALKLEKKWGKTFKNMGLMIFGAFVMNVAHTASNLAIKMENQSLKEENIELGKMLEQSYKVEDFARATGYQEGYVQGGIDTTEKIAEQKSSALEQLGDQEAEGIVVDPDQDEETPETQKFS